jgi:hypothetical protein
MLRNVTKYRQPAHVNSQFSAIGNCKFAIRRNIMEKEQLVEKATPATLQSCKRERSILS